MREICLIANTKDEITKLENLKSDRNLPVVFKELLVPLYAQGNLEVSQTIDDYLKKMKIPQLSDGIDKARVRFYMQNYILLNDAEEVFLDIAKNEFNRLFDKKLFHLSEGVRLIEYAEGKWQVAPSSCRPTLLEFLNRYKKMTGSPVEDLIEKVNRYNPQKKDENESRILEGLVAKTARLYENEA
jgi:hypothetical protein